MKGYYFATSSGAKFVNEYAGTFCASLCILVNIYLYTFVNIYLYLYVIYIFICDIHFNMFSSTAIPIIIEGRETAFNGF
jgi:hypothetical protein